MIKKVISKPFITILPAALKLVEHTVDKVNEPVDSMPYYWNGAIDRTYMYLIPQLIIDPTATHGDKPPVTFTSRDYDSGCCCCCRCCRRRC